MLAEHDRELLTAYVDGELGTRQRKAVLRLLRRCPEARALLRQLQDDARLLRQLPRVRAGEDLSARVLQTIGRRGLHPARRAARPAPTVPIWTVLAAASSVLLAVGMSTFLFFATVLPGRGRPPAVVRNGNDRNNEKEKGTGRAEPGTEAARKDGPGDAPRRPDGKDEKAPNRTEVADKDRKREGPEKSPESPPIAAAPHMESFRPDEADVFVPALFKLRELGQEAKRKELEQKLARGDAFYAELLCRDASLAFPRVQAALQGAGVELVVDQLAQLRLKNPRLRTNYLLYLEDLTPAELGRVLAGLGLEEAHSGPKKAPGPFAGADPNLVLCRMTADHRKNLARFLGTDPRPVPPRRDGAGPPPVDIRRPLAEQTAEQVAAALGGERGPRPSGAAAKKPAERLGVAVMYNPVPPRPQSAEVKRFLDGRKPARPGTLQLLLVLRTRP